jgi:hypothetical protein
VNSNIKPTFINFITNLEQQDLVSLISELVESNDLPLHTQSMILRQSGVDIPADAEVEVITDHNLKKVQISYQSNYNGCSLYVEETIDGTSNESYDEDRLEEIENKVCEAITTYTYENGMVDQENCRLRVSDAEVEQVAREIASSMLVGVEFSFEIDSMST